jgi:hypothetical protein
MYVSNNGVNGKISAQRKELYLLIGLDIFCFVRFVRAEYFRDNDHQVSELTINKCWHVYRAAHCMIIASFSAVLVA